MNAMRPGIRAMLLLAGLAGALKAQSPIGIIISEQSRTSFSVKGAGARAMGLGGAFIAVADDATAVSFNPSGLAQLLKPEMSLVGQGTRSQVAYEDVNTSTGVKQLLVSDSLLSSTHFDPLFISFTAPLRIRGRTLALQVSAQRLIALGESDSRDLLETPLGSTSASGSSRLFQQIVQKGQIDLYSFATAYEASQRILLGISVNLWRGAWDLESRSSKIAGGTSSYVDFTQSNHLEGTNINLGLIWRWPTWSLGLVHRTGFHGDYTFSTTLETSAQPITKVMAPFTTGLHWPATTGLGFAYRPKEGLLLTADLVHTAWSKARYISTRSTLDGLSFFDLDKGTRTPDSTTSHLGAEYLVLTGSGNVFPLRVGLSREPLPVVDRITGQQRIILGASLGTGYKHGAYGFDIAYRYGWCSRRASQFLDVDQILSKTPPTSLGTEHLQEHLVVFSFNLQFERQPVERLLRYLFVGD